MRGAGLIGIVVAMFLTAILVLLYMRISLPSPEDVQQKQTAIDRARDRASEVNRLEAERKRQMDESLAP